MPPSKTWIKVDEADFGKMQSILDDIVRTVLGDPVVFSVLPGQPPGETGTGSKPGVLRTATAELCKSLETMRTTRVNEIRKLREALGTYVIKMRAANNDSDRAAIPFQVKTDTTGTTGPKVQLPDSVKK
jgi:hypothetical protein